MIQYFPQFDFIELAPFRLNVFEGNLNNLINLNGSLLVSGRLKSESNLKKKDGLFFTSEPSPKLNLFLIKNKLPRPAFILEFNPKDKINLPIKKTLNSIAGTYICINLINSKIYVGSASINCIFRRYSANFSLGNDKAGSLLVNRAVVKYGLINFAFIVIETTEQVKNRLEILRIEQKYIDLLKPEYNIAKIAGSRLNTK